MRAPHVLLLLLGGWHGVSHRALARPQVVKRPKKVNLSRPPPDATTAEKDGMASDGEQRLAAGDGDRRFLAGATANVSSGEMPLAMRPRLVPFGGSYQSAVGVELIANPGDMIHFTVDGTTPTRDSPSVVSGSLIHVEKPFVTVRARTRGYKNAIADSLETAANYDVQMGNEEVCVGATGVCNAIDGRTGVGYLIPYYHGRQSCGNVTKDIFVADVPCEEMPPLGENIRPQGAKNNSLFYASKMVYVDLVTKTYNRVRIHGITTDFADYFTYDHQREKPAPAADTYIMQNTKGPGLAYQLGIGAYKGQLRVRDVAKDLEDPQLRGFFNGFVSKYARRNGTDHTAAVLQYPHRASVSQAEFDELVRSDETCAANQYAAHSVLSHATNKTYSYSIANGFLSPFFDGMAYSGRAVRHQLETSSTTLIEYVTNFNKTLCCSTIVSVNGLGPLENQGDPNDDDGSTNWVEVSGLYNTSMEYCVTNMTYNMSTGTIKFDTVDDFKNVTHDANGEKPAEAGIMDAIDLSKADDGLRGFMGGFSIGDHAYFVPYFDGKNAGHKVARIHVRNDCNMTMNGTNASTMGPTDDAWNGRTGDSVDGTCAYSNTRIEYLDLQDYDPELSGYFGGFGYQTANGKRYGFLVPYKQVTGPVGGVNTELTVDGYTTEEIPDMGRHARQALGGDQLETAYHGRLVRIDLDLFHDPQAAIEVLDLTTIDQDLRGFGGGFVAASKGYLVPYRNRDLPGPPGYFGKVCSRILCYRDERTLAEFQCPLCAPSLYASTSNHSRWKRCLT